METKKENRGGARKGAGRKPVRDEEKQNELFCSAVKRITGKDDDDESKITLIVKLWEGGSRGQMFVAEHIFGKPKENIEVTNKNEFPDLSGISTEELEQLLRLENEDSQDTDS